MSSLFLPRSAAKVRLVGTFRTCHFGQQLFEGGLVWPGERLCCGYVVDRCEEALGHVAGGGG